MVLVLSHPDYAHGTAAQAWRELLDDLHPDPTMWQALPREVAQLVARARRVGLVQEGGRWRVVGPGAGRARVAARHRRAAGSRA